MGRGSKTDRRTFLKVGAAAGASLLARPLLGQGPILAGSPVYVSSSANMYSSELAKKKEFIRYGVDSCVLELARDIAGDANAKTVGQAWQAILGAVDANTKIALHVTCFYADLFNMNSPQFETIEAIIQGLCGMLNGQFPAGNIRVFDNDMGGVNRVHAVYGAGKLDGLGVEHNLNTFDDGAPMMINGKKLFPHSYLSSATHAINLARLSGHQFAPGSGPGITGCVKGIMGATSDKATTFGDITTFHDSNKIWQGHKDHWKILKNKVRLNILDMVRASEQERLAFSKDVGELCMGKDPCAVDGYGAAKLNQLWTNYPYGSLSIPEAVATIDATWSTQYNKTSCPIPPNYVSDRPNRQQIDDKIRDRKRGQAADSDVKGLIKPYREK